MPRAKEAREPKDIPPADARAVVPENAERINIGEAVYEEAGVCPVCGEKVYRWVNNGHQEHEAMGNRLVVYVAYSHHEPPGTYCQEHDPNAAHRANSPILTPQQKAARPGELWKPRA